MKENFTQGDWSVFGGLITEIRSGLTVIVHWMGFDDAGVSKEESRANANLIAMAPPMYREIQADIDWLRCLMKDAGTYVKADAIQGKIDLKLLLLAKARGDNA